MNKTSKMNELENRANTKSGEWVVIDAAEWKPKDKQVFMHKDKGVNMSLEDFQEKYLNHPKDKIIEIVEVEDWKEI